MKKKALSIEQIKNRNHTVIHEKVQEAASSVLPVILLVLLFTLIFVPVSPGMLLSFLIGSVFVIIGMGLFTLGAERSMTPVGSEIGTALTRTGKLPLILMASFAMGFAVTIAEPDLQVLASEVPSINRSVLIVSVSAGVGVFMMLCMARILHGWKLRTVLMIAYAVIFTLAFRSDPAFLPIAFDSGGVTTGPMTVPFILALGMGVSSIRSDRDAEADSFGLVGLSSAGPVLVVLLLGFFYPVSEAEAVTAYPQYVTTIEIARDYLLGIPTNLMEMAVAILPVIAMTFIFQLIMLHMPKEEMKRIIIGYLYTYIGLVLFMTGVSVGFSNLGRMIGTGIAASEHPWLLVPAAMLLGYYVISAEPAVSVLEKQIEEVSSGAIRGKAIRRSLQIAVMTALGISAVRALTSFPLLQILVHVYALTFLLSFFTPDFYTAIAFDAGGTASGPMTASFLLPFISGACTSAADAFGVVSLVALLPILSIEIAGMIGSRKKESSETKQYSDLEIIDLWGAE